MAVDLEAGGDPVEGPRSQGRARQALVEFRPRHRFLRTGEHRPDHMQLAARARLGQAGHAVQIVAGLGIRMGFDDGVELCALGPAVRRQVRQRPARG